MSSTQVVQTVTGRTMAEVRRARDEAVGDLVELRLDGVDRIDVAFGVFGSFGWSGIAFVWGRSRVRALMHNTRATGGR